MQLASSGGRRLRHAALAARKLVPGIEHVVTRKELSAAAREAEKALKLSATQRLVLGQLVACWGEQVVGRLLVWPSNQRLMATTGLSERAIRNAIRKLIDLQLVVPKDSPNGKRYAVRNAAGAVIDAFGFDLSPLFARRGEWTAVLAAEKQRRELLKRAFDEVTICRRATEEALTALAQQYPTVDCTALESRLNLLRVRTPKRSGADLPSGLIEAWTELRNAAENTFYQAGCDGTTCRQIEAENELPEETCDKRGAHAEPASPHKLPSQLLLPALIVEACPVVTAWPHLIRDVGDVVTAGRFLRASLGAHPSAWKEAAEDIGAIHAAVAVIYVLQLYDEDVSSGRNSIRNPGGYFRSVVRLIKEGRLDLESALLALRRRKMA
ncbi:plasmid replication protein RepC [Microvirga pakistanensis]|uniref:plasmid replication protein RepC n=1 Tax=Microvirga pakistanensis TaxID=1682650 RepID=UPI00106B2718|nr:plasmid replication protein RepC [Microvirga pakistanensis]